MLALERIRPDTTQHVHSTKGQPAPNGVAVWTGTCHWKPDDPGLNHTKTNTRDVNGKGPFSARDTRGHCRKGAFGYVYQQQQQQDAWPSEDPNTLSLSHGPTDSAKCAQRPDSQLSDKETLDAPLNPTHSWQTDFAVPSTSLKCPWAWHATQTLYRNGKLHILNRTASEQGSGPSCS